MSNVIFAKGLKANLPINTIVEGKLYFTEDTGELYESTTIGQPLLKVGDVYSNYVDLSDLQTKNPAIKGKLYLTDDSKVYVYTNNNDYAEISGEGVSGQISANDIIETPTRVFVTPDKSAAIDANTMENTSQTQRIATIEDTLNNMSTTDEKVAMDALGNAKYLSELIDGLTIQNKNGKLTVEGIEGLLSTVYEMNFLQGVSANIQQQINNLSGVSVFRGVFSSLADLRLAPNPEDGQYAIVSSVDSSDYYFYYNGTWEFSHNTTGSADIDINSGTIGMLNKDRYEHQNATETEFTDPTGKISATDTNAAIVEVFRFADSLLKGFTQTVGTPLSQTDTLEISLSKFKQWWFELTNAITNKGVPTSTSNNGSDIVQKIGIIPNITVEGTLKRVSKLNAVAPYVLPIVLSHPLPLEDLCVTLFEYSHGATGIVKYDVKFDNGDKSDFIQNDYVEFDGVARLQKNYVVQSEAIGTWSGEGVMQKLLFDRNDFVSIESFIF